MAHQKFSLNLALILLLAFQVACTTPAPNPASVPTKTPEATLEPTAIPVTIITPIPLPTTVPNQAELIKKVTGKGPVNFVIDTQLLNRGFVPPRFMVLDTWYKYMSSDGAFSVLMHGGIAPKETTSNEQRGKFPPGVKVVRSDYLTSDNQAVTYFENPALTYGGLTPQQILDSFDVAQVMSEIAEVEIISDKRIQLSGFPGRDIVFHTSTKDDKSDLKIKIYMHVRFYAVGNMIYQLTYADLGKENHETEERFLNSFTLHDAAYGRQF